MKMKTLRFGKPRNITPPGLDGIVWRFPYTVVDSDLVGSPREKPQMSSHTLDAEISAWMTINWQLMDDDVPKVLFELGKDVLRQLLQKGDLPEKHKFSVLTNTYPKACPVDPDRIADPAGTVVEIEVNSPIGFAPK
ncbi:MAG: hypothetical protein ABSC38_06190 [Verrucomicrobiia bacterium]